MQWQHGVLCEALMTSRPDCPLSVPSSVCGVAGLDETLSGGHHVWLLCAALRALFELQDAQ